MAEAAHHVQLAISYGKVDGCACAVVLRKEVRVGGHDARQLLGVAGPDTGVESERLILRGRWVPTRTGHVPWHLRSWTGWSGVSSVSRGLRRGRSAAVTAAGGALG